MTQTEAWAVLGVDQTTVSADPRGIPADEPDSSAGAREIPTPPRDRTKQVMRAVRPPKVEPTSRLRLGPHREALVPRRALGVVRANSVHITTGPLPGP